MVYLSALGIAGLCAVPLLPSAFTARMDTIGSYQADASASTRIAVWQWTWNYAKSHPFGGGFEAYRQNRIRYDTVAVVKDAGGATVERSLQVDQGRAYHSAYFEMLGEQGYFGLALWLFINIAGIVRMEALRRRYRDAGEDERWVAPLASALQQGHIVYLLGAAFIAIAFQPFVYMLIGAQIGLDTYLARKRKDAQARPLRRPRATPLPT